ncbi:nicotinamide-nucleotide amidohydrolase family protein [Leptospira ilyithenensis]|uniref:CinA-like protein n=1 Tax=Leptospira ilyithenensis TaxID=2484901 RepID=A0A4R9LPV9_9LEPT|nr:nicotinamide-nucleotide amidohydrolase family protein [Leptospira ilyithenensis]TGN10006.1 nicotinamide-nucleotide amidohydrolase family protein [Leptospira ilyithenensis]
MKQPQITIIATGSEITAGRSIDTNSGWIANRLFEEGWKVRNFIALPDNPKTILEELLLLKRKAENDPDNPILAIMTGGLGSTEDDYTLQTVLDLQNKEREVVEKARIKLQKLIESRGRSYTEILPAMLRQVYVPSGSYTLDNSAGIAVGFAEEIAPSSFLVCMPGVPAEMKEMFNRRLLPFLKRNYGIENLKQTTRWIWSIGESLFQEEFMKNQKDLLSSGMDWGVTAQKGFIKTIFNAKDESLLNEVVSRIQNFYKELCTEDVFTEVHESLSLSRKSLAVAESCTGGLLGAKITDIKGSSAYFLGGVITYSNDQKVGLLGVGGDTIAKFGAVSRETCSEMADGLSDKTNADYSLSITGIAGPDGGTEEKPVGLVWIGRKKKGKPTETFRYLFPGNRETIRENAANTALYLLHQILPEREIK